MKANELKLLSLEQLSAKSEDLTRELFNLKFQLYTGRLENTSRIAAVKKDRARIQTIISEKRS